MVPEHTLTYVVAGELRFQLPTETRLVEPGGILFIRRHQLAKVVKLPPVGGGEFKAISLLLPQALLRQALLRQYAAAQPAPTTGPRSPASDLCDLSADVFWQGYFASLLPYFSAKQRFTEPVAHLKAEEAIGLLLRSAPALRAELFDFSEPGKIDLAAFMLAHYTYHVPLRQFARLTGRSLATFKRDFQKIFAMPPERWLRRQRLEQAYYLISEQR